MADWSEQLRALAPILDRLQPDPQARVGYDLFAGGLAWSDEAPDPAALTEPELPLLQALRPVWRFRATLVAGAPEERYRSAWDLANELFPNWPGFLVDRRDPRWRPVLADLEDRSLDGWEALGARTTANGKPAAATAGPARDVP